MSLDHVGGLVATADGFHNAGGQPDACWLVLMDVNLDPMNPIIGSRSYSDDPETVARMGVEMIRGMHDGGRVVEISKSVSPASKFKHHVVLHK